VVFEEEEATMTKAVLGVAGLVLILALIVAFSPDRRSVLAVGNTAPPGESEAHVEARSSTRAQSVASSAAPSALPGVSEPAPAVTRPAPTGEVAPRTPRPAEVGAGPESTGIPECDSFVAIAEKVLHCEKLPKALREKQAETMERLRDEWAELRENPTTTVAVRQEAVGRCAHSQQIMLMLWDKACH
jgi:hypothetical protein